MICPNIRCDDSDRWRGDSPMPKKCLFAAQYVWSPVPSLGGLHALLFFSVLDQGPGVQNVELSNKCCSDSLRIIAPSAFGYLSICLWLFLPSFSHLVGITANLSSVRRDKDEFMINKAINNIPRLWRQNAHRWIIREAKWERGVAFLSACY